MSKEEFLKIQTCVLKVNIHCDGCEQKVKKILQKIDGVYTAKIDSEQGKVTIYGNVDPATLIKKLAKSGKRAEIWGASKPNNNNNQNQFKNMQIDNGKGGNKKGQGGQKGGGNSQPKGGPQGGGQNPQLQQLQQKGFQLPPNFMKDMRMPLNNMDQNPKSVKFNLPEDEGLTDDEFDGEYDDEGLTDDEFDGEYDDEPVKKPITGNGQGGTQMSNMMNMMKGGAPNGAGNNVGNGGNGKKGGSGGGGGNIPNMGGGNQNQGGGKGGKNGGSNQNQGGGKGGKNGGGQPNGGGNGGQNKNGINGNGGGGVPANGNNSNANGAKKGGMNDGFHGMPSIMGMNAAGGVGQMGNMPMGQTQMGNLSAVSGLPASMNGSGAPAAAAGYFQGAGPEMMAGNPHYHQQQQQLAAMMMNQQRANGNERFQPMMYARPPPAVNIMPPYQPYPYQYQYQYPYPPPPGDRTEQYSMFSEENTSSCNVM